MNHENDYPADARIEKALPDWHSAFAAHADVRTATLHARGSLDLLTLELLRGAFEVLRMSGQVQITIDLSGLTHIDATGARMLDLIRDELVAAGGGMTLIGYSESLERQLKLAGIELVSGCLRSACDPSESRSPAVTQGSAPVKVTTRVAGEASTARLPALG